MNDISGDSSPLFQNPMKFSQHGEFVGNSAEDIRMDDCVKTFWLEWQRAGICRKNSGGGLEFPGGRVGFCVPQSLKKGCPLN